MSFIKNGLVTVNGNIIHDANKLISKGDLIFVDGTKIYKKKLLYYKFNKPTNVISTYKDPKGRKDLSFFIKISITKYTATMWAFGSTFFGALIILK